jgi:beta-glucosidase
VDRENGDLKAESFGRDFFWGASISAAQTESATDLDGKGMSIWDEFCKPKGLLFAKSPIKNQHHLKDGPDFYLHYQADIDLLKSMGFKHFRFSIAWSRILPDGETVNEKGIAFYTGLINYCHEQGITPWVTLYHWDLPQVLEQKGGWTNRDVLKWFRRFASVCVISFPSVKYWMILNEPSVFVGAGYFFGNHAPGKKGFDNFFRAMHHATLCTGYIFDVIKDINPSLQVGSTFSFTRVEGLDDSEKNIKAARTADLLINRMFFEPIIGKGYPLGEISLLDQVHKHMKKKDEKKLAVKLDFIGVQHYTREVFQHNPFNPFLNIRQVEAHKRTDKLTAMNWEVHPPGIFQTLKKINAYQSGIPIVITENGMALDDHLTGNEINDTRRIEYFRTHIAQVKRAIDEGIDVRGYFAWSLMDNFEWAEGYHPRFGLVYVNFETKQRIMKNSGKWFTEFLAEPGNSF